jgi:hypothetical protein
VTAAGLFFQVVITAWISGHPITSTLPTIHGHDEKCSVVIERLLTHLKPHQHRHLQIECVPTDKRAI